MEECLLASSERLYKQQLCTFGLQQFHRAVEETENEVEFVFRQRGVGVADGVEKFREKRPRRERNGRMDYEEWELELVFAQHTQ